MSDKPMDDKDKVDAYISLYKQQMDRYSRTQEIEWKANFGVWALLAGLSILLARTEILLFRFAS